MVAETAVRPGLSGHGGGDDDDHPNCIATFLYGVFLIERAHCTV